MAIFVQWISVVPTVELKSKHIAEKMLEGMVKICDQELHKMTGQPQVLYITNSFLFPYFAGSVEWSLMGMLRSAILFFLERWSSEVKFY